ncbi:MAG TPA: EFR1 family ferrodoxin [Magnetospirillaceae bacterium]|nr:EFR1 family ferrodoxin [Magnetospirillaceae bacterium]
MKALFVYFTGTGNTLRALACVAEELAAFPALDPAGLEASWHEIRDSARPLADLLAGLAESDLLVLGFPALGFSAPEPVIRQLKSLPRLRGFHAAVLCACGASWMPSRILNGWGGTAVPEVLRILKAKGARPAGSAEASYPINWTQVFPPPQGAARADLLKHGDRQARAFGARLARGLGAEPDESRAGIRRESSAFLVRRSALTRLLCPAIARVFRGIGRKLAARFYIADGTCSGCGLCARACPARAVRMSRGRPAWTNACAACNRCINLCPSRSIQTSTIRLVLVSGVNLAALGLAIPALAAALGVLGLASGTAACLAVVPLGAVLFWTFSLLQAGPLDALLRIPERSRALGPVFRRGFTRGYDRYLAPGFRPGEGG